MLLAASRRQRGRVSSAGRQAARAAALALAFAPGAAFGARDVCEMLRDKGVLNDVEYNECKAAQEKEEDSLTRSLQEFAKTWISYKEGTGFVLNSAQTAPQDFRNPTPKPRFSFALGNRLQVRYTFTDPGAANQDESSTFRIRRFKTFLNGNAFYPWLKYKVQTNWVGANEPDTNSQTPELEDAALDVAYFPWVQLQGGQFKVPFDRQELTSSGAQQFVDRSVVNNRFTFARDQGVMLHGFLGAEKAEWFEYSAGIFNGNGRNRANNDNPEHLGVGRLYWTPMGPFRYSESDIDNTPRPMLAIGAAYGFNPVRNTTSSTRPITTTIPDPDDPSQMIDIATGRTLTTTTRADAEIHRAAADIHFKWRGLSALADYAYESRDDQMTEVTLTETGANGSVISTMSGMGRDPNAVQTHGFNLQAGVFLIPKRLEIAGRFAFFNPEGPDNRVQEARGAINCFFFAHNLKLQVDAGQVTRGVRGDAEQRDVEARVQAQVIF